MKVDPFDTKRQVTFTRRATLAAGGVTVLFGGIVARLYDLQVRRYAEFAEEADSNRFKQRIVIPLRGDILDRYGNPIATNRQNFRVLFNPAKMGDVAETIAALEDVLPQTAAERDRILEEISRRSRTSFEPIEIIDNLSWDDYAAANFKAGQLSGVETDVVEMRYYPDQEAVAAVVGHVGTPDQRDLSNVADEERRTLYRLQGFKLGKLGLELAHDEHLRGNAGTKTVEVTAAGRVIREDESAGDQAQQGGTLALTIDSELQREAYRVLSEDYGEYPATEDGPEPISGSAVVMDVVTGDILVMASAPSFDPNLFAGRVDASEVSALKRSPLKPMVSKPVAGRYPPGSTFKLITALAAQQAGIPATKRFYCPGTFRYGDRSHGCWKREGHGWLDLEGAIKHSCDVYFYNCALEIDIDDLAKLARSFGLGQTYDIGLTGEARGIVPDRQWKKDYFRTRPEMQNWFPGETISVSIGQGALTSTPLQLAVMAARLATGLRVTPRLVRGTDEDIEAPPAFPFMGIPDSEMQVIRAGMDAVVNEWGTAARSSLMPDFRMAGKTGTSQTRSLKINPETGKPFKNAELPWAERDHALFVAFAPFDNPRYAISVVTEHGGSGSKSAGPRARDIMRAVLEKDPANAAAHDLWRPGGRGMRASSKLVAQEG